MDSDLLQATVILSIEAAELYSCVNQRSSLLETGPLNILYMMSHNCFLLQINSFTYQLSKEIPVLASPAEHPHEYPSYAFPNINGYSIVKIIKIKSPEALSGFESLLNNHCNLAYKQEEETTIGDDRTIEIGEATLETGEKEKKAMAKPKNPKTEMASNIISKGGEMTKKGLIVSAEVISKGIAKIGDFVQKKYIKKTVEKDVSESTIVRLEGANATTAAVYTFTKAQFQVIMVVGKEITKEVGRQIQKSDAGQKFENYKYHDTIVEVGKSSIHAVACIYEGMAEALAVIGRGISNTTTKIVTQKYGEKMGNATKQGFDAVGNIGKITQVYTEEGAKVISEQTAKKQ